MRIVLSLLITLTVMVSQVNAQARSWERGPRGPWVTVVDQPTFEQATDAEEVVRTVFSEIEKRIIERYFGNDEETGEAKDKKGKAYKGKSKGLPPGLAKRNTLPPGLARHVRLYGALPPGLQKRNLPEDLEALLPERPYGQERVVVGDDVLLLEKVTGLILDVIEDVIQNTGTAQ
jgi:hypothetical protein